MAVIDTPVLTELAARTEGATKVYGSGDTQVTALDGVDVTFTFVFQAFNLVPTLSTIENITLPLDLGRSGVDEAWLDEVIRAVGLADRLEHKPNELSRRSAAACRRGAGAGVPARGRPSPMSPPATSTPPPAPRSCPSCGGRSTSTTRPS